MALSRHLREAAQQYEDVVDIGVIDEEECKQYTTPKPNSHKPVVDLVMEDLEKRKAFGIKKYGTPLQPFNGRSAKQDALEEVYDLACYIKQLMLEDKWVRSQLEKCLEITSDKDARRILSSVLEVKCV